VGGNVKVVPEWVWRTYSAVNDMLIPCIIVDVYCHAAEGRDFGGEFVEARVVLLFALVGLRHCCAVPFRGFLGLWSRVT
jgi:hypothetical protein